MTDLAALALNATNEFPSLIVVDLPQNCEQGVATVGLRVTNPRAYRITQKPMCTICRLNFKASIFKIFKYWQEIAEVANRFVLVIK